MSRLGLLETLGCSHRLIVDINRAVTSPDLLVSVSKILRDVVQIAAPAGEI